MIGCLFRAPAGGGGLVIAELARTPAQHARGLAGRRRLPSGHGMLFVFDDDAPRWFWMRATPLPLDMLKVIVLIVLWSQGKEPDSLMFDELFVDDEDDEPRLLH